MAVKLCFIFLSLSFIRHSFGATYYGHENPSKNLFGNGDFDAAIPDTEGTHEWYYKTAMPMHLGLVSDSNICFSGNNCVHLQNRTATWAALKSRINASSLQASTLYAISMFTQFTEDAGVEFQVSLVNKYNYHNGTVLYDGQGYTQLRAGGGWVYFHQLITTPDSLEQLDWLEIYIDAPVDIGFMLDATSMTEVNYPDWNTTAQANIETYRKGDVTIMGLINSSCYDYQKVEIQFLQIESAFPFGTAVDANVAGYPYNVENTRYMQYFSGHFNWASFKNKSTWSEMEGSSKVEDDTKFAVVDPALRWMEHHNIKVLGHSLHKNKAADQPGWVDSISDNAQFISELKRRIDYMADHYFGQYRFEHWVVSDEHVADDYLEGKTGKEDILVDLFNMSYLAESGIGRLTNDPLYTPLLVTTAVNNAFKLKDLNLLSGIGMTDLFNTVDSYDSSILDFTQKQLDIMRSIGLPIWLTDVDTNIIDLVERAQFLRDVLYMYFGTPEVEGIMLGGFEQLTKPWCFNSTCSPRIDDYENNEAGQVWEDLTQNVWRSNETYTAPADLFTNTFRLFYGTYEMKVKYDGSEASTYLFTLDKNEHKIFDIVLACID